VEQVVVPIEAVDVHATRAVTVPQRCQARSLRLIHHEHRIAHSPEQASELVIDHY
jgi:hypothetical protein